MKTITPTEALESALEAIESHYDNCMSGFEEIEPDNYICIYRKDEEIELAIYHEVDINTKERNDFRFDLPGDPLHNTKILYYWTVSELFTNYFELKRKN